MTLIQWESDRIEGLTMGELSVADNDHVISSFNVCQYNHFRQLVYPQRD